MEGKLYIVATPIGNLDDITYRAVKVLNAVDLIAAEDTRHTLKLLNHLEISKPLMSYYKETEKVKAKIIIDKLKEVIKTANDSIYCELWSTDYKQLENEIMDAYDRGVSIKIVGYDNLESVFGLVYSHQGAKELEYYLGSRMVFLLADNTESIWGRIEKQVVWTKHRDIAFLMKEFMVHDMYLLDVYQRFPEQLKYFYGAGFKKLKEKILDKKSTYNIH